MKITFVYPDFLVTRKNPNSDRFYITEGGWYSEGIASLSVVLKEQGYQVSLIHLIRPIIREEFQTRLEKEKPDILAFTLRTSAFSYVQEYLKWAKETDVSLITVLGGYHPTLAPEDCIKVEGADIICVGEGEEPLVDLCQALTKKQNFENIPNLLIKRGDRIIKNSCRQLIHPLDSLPLPDFELFNFPNLISSQTKVATVMISRGCPYNCGYCCNHKLREVYPDPQHYTRFRSPQNVMLYLKKLLNLYPWISSIRFLDNIFGIEKKWVEEFSQLYKKEINLPFSCDHRSNLATLEILKLLKEAGCYQIYFGVESGDEEFRSKVLSRYTTNKQIEETFSHCRQVGIKTLAYNIVGSPLETPSKALQTIKLNAEIKPDTMVVNIFTPYPYTKLSDISLKEGFLNNPLVDYRDEVFITQPDFPNKEVLFFSLYFPFLTWLYSLTKTPSFLWSLWDKIILGKYLPKGILIILMKNWIVVSDNLKAVLRKKLPFIYIFLRDRIFRR